MIFVGSGAHSKSMIYQLLNLFLKGSLLLKSKVQTDFPMKSSILAFVTCAFAISAHAQTDSAEYFYQKGMTEKQAGRRLEVWKNLDKAYKYNPNDKKIVTELAISLLDLRRYTQAREMFQKLEVMGDQSPELYRQLLDLSFTTRKHDDVIIYANKLKKVDGSAKVNYMLGKVYYDQDNYGQAIKYLESAQKEEPQNGEIPYLIGRSYGDMMNYKLAVPYFQKAIELDQAKGNWVYELGLMCYAMHDDKNALKYILLAGERGYKKDNDYLENLGIAYLNVGNLEEGLKIMKEILVRKPMDMNILNMTAEALYYGGKFNEAIEYWDRILEIDKTSAQSLYMIGMCYQKKGEKEKGQALCDKAIEMDPSLSVYKQKKQMMGL